MSVVGYASYAVPVVGTTTGQVLRTGGSIIKNVPKVVNNPNTDFIKIRINIK